MSIQVKTDPLMELFASSLFGIENPNQYKGLDEQKNKQLKMQQIRRAAKKLLAYHEEQMRGRWHVMASDPPKKEGKYLVFQDFRGTISTSYNIESSVWNGQSWYHFHAVTHWMEWPFPPEADK